MFFYYFSLFMKKKTYLIASKRSNKENKETFRTNYKPLRASPLSHAYALSAPSSKQLVSSLRLVADHSNSARHITWPTNNKDKSAPASDVLRAGNTFPPQHTAPVAGSSSPSRSKSSGRRTTATGNTIANSPDNGPGLPNDPVIG